MIQAAKVGMLSIDSVLSKVTQEQIMVYYLGIPINLNSLFSSPFRQDSKPSCSFYYGKQGRLYLHDFGQGVMYTFVDIVMKKLHCSYYNALKDIDANIEKISYFTPTITEKEEVEYTYTSSRFTEEYFAKHGIDKNVLLKFNVKLTGDVFKNGKLWAKSTKADPIYVYEINDRCKVYRPLTPNTKNKWRSTAKIEDVFGMKQLAKNGTLCIITSSVKDMMVLHTHGFPAICFNSETLPKKGENAVVVDAIIDAIKSRYKYVASLMDSDDAGQKSASHLEGKFGIPSMFTPYVKDIADHQLLFKRKKTGKVVRRLIRKTFSLNNLRL